MQRRKGVVLAAPTCDGTATAEAAVVWRSERKAGSGPTTKAARASRRRLLEECKELRGGPDKGREAGIAALLRRRCGCARVG